MNLSFAVPVDEPAIRDAVQYALDRDVVVVAAAGNEARSQPGLTWYPAAYDGVLAVASVDRAGQPVEESNRGAWVDAAPGVQVTAPSSGGDGYVAVEGTSFATAVVSGVAALVRARYPQLSVADVVRRIEATAVSPTGGRDERTGAGIVDPYLALTAENVAAPPRPAADGRGAEVRVLPVTHDPPLLNATAATAGIATVILVAGAAAAAGVGVTVRRISTRRQRAGSSDSPIALDHDASAYRPVVPVPTDRLN